MQLHVATNVRSSAAPHRRAAAGWRRLQRVDTSHRLPLDDYCFFGYGFPYNWLLNCKVSARLHIPNIVSVGKNQLTLYTDENELVFGRLNVFSATGIKVRVIINTLARQKNR